MGVYTLIQEVFMDYSLRGYPKEQLTIFVIPSERKMIKLEEVNDKSSGKLEKVFVRVKVIKLDNPNITPEKLEKYLNDGCVLFASTERLSTRKVTNLDLSKYETSKDKPVRTAERKDKVVEEVKAGKKEEPAPIKDVKNPEEDLSATINRVRAPERAIRRLERLAALQDINFIDEAHPENAINFDVSNVETLDEKEYEALAKEVNEIFSGVRAPEENEKKEKKEVKEREMVHRSHAHVREHTQQSGKPRQAITARDVEMNYLQRQGAIEKDMREKARETREKDKKRRREDIKEDDLKREIRTGEVNKTEKQSAGKRSEINKGAR